MLVLGLDPGYRESALIVFDGQRVLEPFLMENDVLLTTLETFKDDRGTILVIEQISMGGMIAGAEIFETCFWSGRFAERWSPRQWDRIKRKDVKLHLCGQVRATDANVRMALIDRFGPDKDRAIGRTHAPGPLYGVKSHCWAALAVAVTWFDHHHPNGDVVRPGVLADF